MFQEWRGEGQDQLTNFPMRSFLDAGVRVSIASDYPCAGLAPVEHTWTAVARSTVYGTSMQPDEGITAEEALHCYTSAAARARCSEDEEGTITVGKRANLLVLDRDTVTCLVDEIREVQMDLTWVDGTLVHDRLGGDHAVIGTR